MGDRMTNNQDREALSVAIGGVLFNATNFPERVQPRILGQDMGPLTAKLTDAVCAVLAARRLPVSGDTAEWRDSEFKKFMSRGLRSTNEGTVLWHRQREAFNAAWALTSQPREAAPSDSDRALKAERLRQLAASYRMDLKSPSTAAMLDDAANTLSRTSHPVQVEVAPSGVDGVLAMLDDLNASGGIAYDDYSRLHDAVAMLGPTEPVQVEVTEHKITQRMPWSPSPDSRFMLSLFECSCGWKTNTFKDTRDNRATIEDYRQYAESHAAALGGGE